MQKSYEVYVRQDKITNCPICKRDYDEEVEKGLHPAPLQVFTIGIVYHKRTQLEIYFKAMKEWKTLQKEKRDEIPKPEYPTFYIRCIRCGNVSTTNQNRR